MQSLAAATSERPWKSPLINIVTNSGRTRKKREVYFNRELDQATHGVVEPGRREHDAQINEARECTSRELTHKPQYKHSSLSYALVCECHSVNEYRTFKYKVHCTVGSSPAELITTSNVLLPSGSK